MFYYFGSKGYLAKYYPAPKHNLIIEPFAGAAGYSCFYGLKQQKGIITNKTNNVVLNDKFDKIYKTWKWLIDEAEITDMDIFDNLRIGDSIKDYDLDDGFMTFLKFAITVNSGGSNKVTLFGADEHGSLSFRKKKFVNLLERIKHWKILQKDYLELDNMQATWFIDPPYKTGGDEYHLNKIDYQQLADWCISRKGQVIVCENEGNEGWLDFKPFNKNVSMTKQNGKKHIKREMIWYRENNNMGLKKLRLTK